MSAKLLIGLHHAPIDIFDRVERHARGESLQVGQLGWDGGVGGVDGEPLNGRPGEEHGRGLGSVASAKNSANPGEEQRPRSNKGLNQKITFPPFFVPRPPFTQPISSSGQSAPGMRKKKRLTLANVFYVHTRRLAYLCMYPGACRLPLSLNELSENWRVSC